MQTLKIALLILGSVILQITLVAKISMFGGRPDLPLALVVSAALLKGSLHGGLVGFAAGLLCDLFSEEPLGIQSFSGAVIGYCIAFVSARLYSDSFITQLVSGFTAALASKFIISIHLSLLLGDLQLLRIRFLGLILAAMLNSVFVVPIFFVLKKFVYGRET
jgi:rod shape-determining protein MreD